jgi:multidrug efflux pump subunit AcrA (membrane-fusion protein)
MAAAGAGGGGFSSMRVIYKLTGTDEKPVLEPVRVRTGISDSSYTEIVSGVEEGDRIVTAVTLSGMEASAPSARQGGIPGMGGGGRGFRGF